MKTEICLFTTTHVFILIFKKRLLGSKRWFEILGWLWKKLLIRIGATLIYGNLSVRSSHSLNLSDFSKGRKEKIPPPPPPHFSSWIRRACLPACPQWLHIAQTHLKLCLTWFDFTNFKGQIKPKADWRFIDYPRNERTNLWFFSITVRKYLKIEIVLKKICIISISTHYTHLILKMCRSVAGKSMTHWFHKFFQGKF